MLRSMGKKYTVSAIIILLLAAILALVKATIPDETIAAQYAEAVEFFVSPVGLAAAAILLSLVVILTLWKQKNDR